jgi:hypothetical protein
LDPAVGFPLYPLVATYNLVILPQTVLREALETEADVPGKRDFLGLAYVSATVSKTSRAAGGRFMTGHARVRETQEGTRPWKSCPVVIRLDGQAGGMSIASRTTAEGELEADVSSLIRAGKSAAATLLVNAGSGAEKVSERVIVEESVVKAIRDRVKTDAEGP